MWALAREADVVRKRLRIVLFSIAGALLLVTAGLALIWKASRHVPEFYRQALQDDPAAQVEASDEMIRRALALASDLKQEGRWEATFTAQQINGWLAVDLVKNHTDKLPPSLSEPRVAIGQDGFTAACRFRRGYVQSVLWLAADATMDEPNVLAVRIRKARAGALPLPLGNVFDRITEAARRSGLGIKWRQADGDPVAFISLPPPDGRGKRVTRIDAFRLSRGELYLAGATERRTPAEQ